MVGATGAVGRTMLSILEQRKFPVGNLSLLASERSAGEKMTFNNKQYTVENLAEFDFSNAHIGLFSPGASVSAVYAPKLVRRAVLLSIIPRSSATSRIFRWLCRR